MMHSLPFLPNSTMLALGALVKMTLCDFHFAMSLGQACTTGLLKG
jgi:hypothetical protein